MTKPPWIKHHRFRWPTEWDYIINQQFFWMLCGRPINFYSTSMTDVLFCSVHQAKARWKLRKLLRGGKKLVSLILSCIHETLGKEALRKISSIYQMNDRTMSISSEPVCQSSALIVYFCSLCILSCLLPFSQVIVGACVINGSENLFIQNPLITD